MSTKDKGTPIRMLAGAAQQVRDFAAERGLTLLQAASDLVGMGWVAYHRPETAEDDALVSQLSTLVKDTPLGPWTVAQYAEERNMSEGEAIVRLILVGLGREAALRKDRTKREHKQEPCQPKVETSAPNPWRL